MLAACWVEICPKFYFSPGRVLPHDSRRGSADEAAKAGSDPLQVLPRPHGEQVASTRDRSAIYHTDAGLALLARDGVGYEIMYDMCVMYILRSMYCSQGLVGRWAFGTFYIVMRKKMRRLELIDPLEARTYRQA